ncbi:MAG TPA: anti-sigma factor domain-containing protein, partial [Clostridia bacterium]|nr:anti-sigma factor domain-containing protein [Clostridia bacterium]
MKGILIEKAGRNSVVMANDGKFMKVSGRKSWNTGDEVEFPSAGARAAKAVSIAAMFVIVMALSLFGVYAANSYTVNLDVNPSIEIEVNAFNNVTEITALND